MSIEDNLRSFLPSLTNYIRIHQAQEIDAFIIQVTDKKYFFLFNWIRKKNSILTRRYGESPETVKNLVSEVLRFFENLEMNGILYLYSLASHVNIVDLKNQGKAKEKKKKISLDYGISFLKTRLFLTPFAPCYEPTSSRYAFGEKVSTFLLLQSSHSFNLLNRLAENDWDKILELRYDSKAVLNFFRSKTLSFFSSFMFRVFNQFLFLFINFLNL